MFSRVISASTFGIDAYRVEVETHSERQLPSITIVGLPDNAVKESRERVSAALKNTGIDYSFKKITVNLAPADIKKEGSAFDLPIAIGILAANELVNLNLLDETMILGELSLDGSLRKIKGGLPVAVEARRLKLKSLVLPEDSVKEASIVDGIKVYGLKNLKEVIDFLNGSNQFEPTHTDKEEVFSQINKYHLDFSDVKGQENAKRALEIAAAGGHNIIMIGPPGSGKTMLAKRLPTILPPLTFEEALETTKIHSVAGILPRDKALITERPFRSPHHTVSDAALIGGGSIPRPGEVSYAHHGVLFLDELPEFKKNVLEVMRQPLEDSKVTISRSKMSVEFPANFMLAAAMNPCPCGYYTDPSKECTCTQAQIQKYMARISGPLLDRIDIHIEVPAVKYKELSSELQGEKSEEIRKRVVAARHVQLKRFEGLKNIYCNADMGSRELRKFCRLDNQCNELLKMAMTRLGFSARAYDRIIKVSRTIADIELSENILPQHISEAIQYRALDRELWGH
ncbi:Mg chelatase-related protein [Melioribacter roseus P3M-2]|uniref:Mg chelatase-related protein n=1 Tax=Melioribacter roseus (strain DSM 23840 / JCM 17771 / VKM B-2668 / P3M-2) TaxID=1191523 RepID=I6YXG1_MELRP|nr:YifB family Mg chelatase-like AAA ATPase [Melioribacter roseus]AFN75267.1 Mg chelatase-related protein [Melioribacter roseus P3M-2]